jgi:HK97 family phage portal protein
MAWWNFKKENRDAINTGLTLDQILSSYVGASEITKTQAMMVPSVASCVNLISDTVASLPIKLYEINDEQETTEEVKGDPRIALLNVDTGDTLNPYMMKKAMVEDLLMDGAGYIYINKYRNTVKSLNYVQNDQVGVMVVDPNPIFKKLEFVVYGQTYKEFDFLKVTRKTTDGVQGYGILKENNQILSVAYNQLLFEDLLYRTGGNKKGYLSSQNRLSEPALQALKTAFANLYQNNTENVIVLNAGVEFKESNSTAVEMQVNANKETNDEAICKIFGVPTMLLGGKTASAGVDMVYDSWFKLSIIPILKAIETALNRDLLLSKEKGRLAFQFDAGEVLRADILKRYQSYQLAIESGILQVDEIRNLEGWAPIDFNFIKLGLQDVLYRPDTGEIYTPNTNQLVKMGQQIEGAGGTGVPTVDSPKAQDKPQGNTKAPQKGGDNNESGNKK